MLFLALIYASSEKTGDESVQGIDMRPEWCKLPSFRINLRPRLLATGSLIKKHI